MSMHHRQRVDFLFWHRNCVHPNETGLQLHNGKKRSKCGSQGIPWASPGISIPTSHWKQAIAGSESTQAQTPQGEDLGHLLTKQPWKGWLRVREVWKG